MMVEIPVNCGELFDRMTILEIKATRVEGATKLMYINFELGALMVVKHQLMYSMIQDKKGDGHLWLNGQIDELRKINEALWDTEEFLRRCESTESFGPDFVRQARQVYKLNDKRSRVKADIAHYTDAAVIEQKSY